MKWLLLALVVLVLIGIVWLRTARQHTASASRPHRLDDCLSTRDTGEPAAADDPVASGAQVSDTGTADRP